MWPALLPTTVTSVSIPDPPLRIRHLRQPVSDVAVDAILPVLVEIAVVLNMSWVNAEPMLWLKAIREDRRARPG